MVSKAEQIERMVRNALSGFSLLSKADGKLKAGNGLL